MPTHVHRYPSQELNRLLDELLDDAEVEAHKLAADIEVFLRKQFERTFAHWGNSKRNKFAVPSVKITKKVIRNRKDGIRIVLTCLVTDGSTAHVLWHWLSFGTKDYTAKKNLVFRSRVKARTQPHKLDVDPFPGWGDWVTIKKGRVRKGIEPREWYEAIADELRKYEDRLLKNKKYSTYYVVQQSTVKKPA